MANEFKRVWVLLAGLLGLVLAWKVFYPVAPPVVHPEVLDFTWVDQEGKRGALSDFRGRWLLVNFWAPWCDPCRQELPYLKKMEEGLDPAGPLMIIGISTETVAFESEFWDEQKYPKNMYVLETSEVLSRWGVQALPTSFLVSPEGKVEEVFQGIRRWDETEQLSKIFSKISSRSPEVSP